MAGDLVRLGAWGLVLLGSELLLLRLLTTQSGRVGRLRAVVKRSSPVVVVALLASHAAATTMFVAPTQWSRDDSQATYYEWDVFTMLPGATFPFTAAGLHPADVWSHGPGETGATLEEKTGTGLITSSQNIYSFAAATSFDLNVPAYGLGEEYYTTVILQTSSQGSPLDPDSVHLVGSDEEPIAPHVTHKIFEGVLPSSIGDVDVVEYWFQWNLPATFGLQENYLLQFGAAASSMSLANVSVDTFTSLEPVVEPTPAGLGLAADFNSDGEVNLADFNILKTNFGNGAATFDLGDATGDGTVDLEDFNILKGEFGSGGAAVPEPTTVLLSLCGLMLLPVMRRTAIGRRANIQ